MDRSLEDYIAGNPTLQAAIVGARFRAKYEKRIYNSGEFPVESRHYVCTEKDTDNEMENEKEESADTKDATNKSFAQSKTFEEAFLELDLNEEDFDKWYKEHACNNSTKKTEKTTKEYADSSYHDNEYKKNAFCSADTVPNSAPNKIKSNLLKQPGFDMRQVIGKKSKNEQDFVSPNGNNKHCYKHKQTRWGNRNNGHMRNNVPYENKRNGNEQFRRSVQLFHNHNPINGNGLFGNGVNTGCSSFQTPAPVNHCQSCFCHKRAIMGNELTLNNAAGYVGSRCNVLGCNGAAVNTASCCYFNNMSNAFGGGAYIFGTSLNNSVLNGGCSNANVFQHNNLLNESFNSNGRGCQTNKERLSTKGKNLKETNVSGNAYQSSKNSDVVMDSGDNQNEGTTAKDFEITPMPVMLALMQEIFKNGISINFIPEKQNQSK